MGEVVPRRQVYINQRTGWDYESQENRKLQQKKKDNEAKASDSLMWDVRGDRDLTLGC